MCALPLPRCGALRSPQWARRDIAAGVGAARWIWSAPCVLGWVSWRAVMGLPQPTPLCAAAAAHGRPSSNLITLVRPHTVFVAHSRGGDRLGILLPVVGALD